MIGPQRKSSTYSEMAVRILSPILLLTVLASICIAQFAEPNAPYPVINRCKNCQRRRLMSCDQECSLEEATKQVQPCRCDADCTTYRDCCPSTHHTCLDSGEETAPFLCQDIILTSQGYIQFHSMVITTGWCPAALIGGWRKWETQKKHRGL